MKLRLFSIVKKHDGYINGNSCNPKDWDLVSYRNDIVDVPDALDDAALALRAASLAGRDKSVCLYVLDTNPAEAREILSERIPYATRTRALKLWCMGAFTLYNSLREKEV